MLGAEVEGVFVAGDVGDGDALSLPVEVVGAAVASGGADAEGVEPAFDLVELGPVASDLFHAGFVEFEVGPAKAEVVVEGLLALLADNFVQRCWPGRVEVAAVFRQRVEVDIRDTLCGDVRESRLDAVDIGIDEAILGPRIRGIVLFWELVRGSSIQALHSFLAPFGMFYLQVGPGCVLATLSCRRFSERCSALGALQVPQT